MLHAQYGEEIVPVEHVSSRKMQHARLFSAPEGSGFTICTPCAFSLMLGTTVTAR